MIPEFSNQWQYINTGQNGGKVGADMDMDQLGISVLGGLSPLEIPSLSVSLMMASRRRILT